MTGVGKLALTKDDLGAVVHGFCAVAVVACVILGTSMPLLSYTAFIIALGYVLLASNEQAICFAFFLLPFGNIFKSEPSSASFFTYLTIALAVKLFLSKRLMNKYFVLSWAVLLVLQVAGCDMDYSLLIKQATILLLIYGYFWCCKPITREIVLHLTAGILISCCAAFMTDFFSGVHQYMRYVRAYELSVDLYRFTGLYSDPNYLTQILVLLCVSLFVLMQSGKIGKIGWIFCAAIVFFGMQTLSKSFFLMLGVLVLVFIAIAFQKKRYALAVLMLLLSCGLILFFLSGKSTYYNNMLQRLLYNQDITTGRVDIWKEYILFFFSNPATLLFGVGIAGESLELQPHSTYIDFLYYYGIFGTLIFGWGLFCAVGQKLRRSTILNRAPAICFGILIAFLSDLLMFDFAYILIMVIAFLTDDMSPKSKEQEGWGILV